ncbi:MAG TPA: hypothetical protein VME19_22020 [Streptosporangiaceae bacterium]|nr:hypothetical protein [Streptosporangiaceae bacterium]
MTQDQWGQPANPGYVVRGEVVPNDEPTVPPAGQVPPMTHFQKVASRADQADPPTDQEPDETPEEEEEGAVSSPDAGQSDYWDVGEDEATEDPAAGDPAARTDEDTSASVSEPATDPGTGPGTGPAAPAEDAAASISVPATEPGADDSSPNGHEATDPSMTPAGATSRSAGEIQTVPIPLATASAGDQGRHAAPALAEPETEPEPEAELRPGQSGTTLPLGESGYASLIPDAGDVRAQWHRIQYKFVDDPRVSVTEAADAIAQVAARLEAAIAERQRGLRGRWDSAGTVDTETLRETLRMYRSFLDQLIGPEPS